MINQFRFALKDLKKNIYLVIIFIFQLFISLLFILLLSNQLIQQIVSTKQFSKLYKESYYSLKSYVNESIPITINGDLDKILSNTLNGNTHSYSAFTTVIKNNNKQVNVVIGLGGFGQIFNLDSKIKNKADINVLLGKNVKGYKIGDVINFGTFSSTGIKINGNLPKGSYYVDNNGLYNLDNSIIILSTWDKWKKFNTIDYAQNILTNIKFIDTDKEDVEKFAQEASISNKKWDIVPLNVTDILKQKKENSNGQSVFLIFFICIVIMICIGIFSNLMQLIDSNLREYSIHRLYGSKLKDIYIRVIIYISTIIIFTFIPMTLVFKVYPLEMLKYIPILFIALFIIITVSIVTYPILKLKKHSIPTFLRRDI